MHVALGRVDSMGIAPNSMQRLSVWSFESWGRPRGEEFAGGPTSWLLGILNIYCNFLSLGYVFCVPVLNALASHGATCFFNATLLTSFFDTSTCRYKIAASAGSASSYSQNPNGFNRVYAMINPQATGGLGTSATTLTWDTWMEAAYRSGRSFVTNGPLLHRCTVNSAPPGARFAAADELVLHVDAYAASASRLDRVELIVGGTVAHTWQPDNVASGCHARDTEPVTYAISGNITITVNASTWVAIRAFEAGPHTATWLRYAHTSPWYVDIANKPPQSATAANFLSSGLMNSLQKWQPRKPRPLRALHAIMTMQRLSINVHAPFTPITTQPR